MPSKKTVKKVWTKEEIKKLRALASKGMSGTAIAKVLKRTRGATYQRAALTGIRLKSVRRTRRK